MRFKEIDADGWKRERAADGTASETFPLEATLHNQSATTFFELRVIFTGEGLVGPRVVPFGHFWPDRRELINTKVVMPEGTLQRVHAGENRWDVEVLFVDDDDGHWHLQRDYRVRRISGRQRKQILEQHETRGEK